MKNYTFIDGDIRTLYCLAIPKQREGLRTIRDLTAEHLVMLRSIRDKGYESIQSRYAVPKDKLLAYFHYQPSYYHLHVHFVHIELKSRDTRSCVNLEEVISNIEMISDYYQRAT